MQCIEYAVAIIWAAHALNESLDFGFTVHFSDALSICINR